MRNDIETAQLGTRRPGAKRMMRELDDKRVDILRGARCAGCGGRDGLKPSGTTGAIVARCGVCRENYNLSRRAAGLRRSR
jgi:hypothetical protein